MAKHETGPKGGVTTIAPSGWQRTSVYLRKDQVRTLKLAGLDGGSTMSEVLRRAIDRYFEEDARLSEYQRTTTEMLLREQFEAERDVITEFLAVLESYHPDDD